MRFAGIHDNFLNLIRSVRLLGKFSDGDVFESQAETDVSVTAWSLEYRIDSKDFYRLCTSFPWRPTAKRWTIR